MHHFSSNNCSLHFHFTERRLTNQQREITDSHFLSLLLNLPAFDSVSQGDLVAAEKQEAAARKKAQVRITSHHIK